MNLEKYLRLAAAALFPLSITTPLAHAADGWLGELAPLALTNAIAESGKQVGAVVPDPGLLSDADQQLAREMAANGIRQVELSKVAASLSTSDDVRMIAKGEITSQTSVADKLREIALAGGAALPTAPDDETKQVVENLRNESGPGFDRMYLKTAGIAGHEKLMATMEKARAESKSPALRELAVAALPLIHTHLRLVRVELADMK